MADVNLSAADVNGYHPDAIYHEHQSLELCLLHALNNLFQGQAFAQESLETICKELAPDTWVNPHKSFFGLGNYDVNVLIAALQQKDCTAVWFDRRLDPSALEPSQVIGFILNLPSQVMVGMVKVPFLEAQTLDRNSANRRRVFQFGFKIGRTKIYRRRK